MAFRNLRLRDFRIRISAWYWHLVTYQLAILREGSTSSRAWSKDPGGLLSFLPYHPVSSRNCFFPIANRSVVCATDDPRSTRTTKVGGKSRSEFYPLSGAMLNGAVATAAGRAMHQIGRWYIEQQHQGGHIALLENNGGGLSAEESFHTQTIPGDSS